MNPGQSQVRARLAVVEATLARLEGCEDEAVVQLIAAKTAVASALRLQLQELKPTKARLASTAAARDNALKLVQRARLDLATLEEMVLKKRVELGELEQDGVAKSLAAEHLTAQYAAEVQELLSVPSPATPPPSACAGTCRRSP